LQVANNAIRTWQGSVMALLFFVANETSPFLAGVFEAVFGAEKGWKKNETNRETLDITGFSDLSLLYYKGNPTQSR